MKPHKTWRRVLSGLLSLGMVCSQVPPVQGVQIFTQTSSILEGQAEGIATYSLDTKATEEYSVYFMDGDTKIAENSTNQGKVTAPTEPTKEGHTLVGWYQEKAFATLWDFDYTVTVDTTLYGRWDINSYTVTYKIGDDDSTIDPEEVVYNTVATEPSTPTAPIGQEFDGWYTDEACKELYDFSTLVTSDITLYARWVAEKYTVTFQYNNDTASADVGPYQYGSTISAPPIPIKMGHTFEGWYTDEACKELYDFSTLVTSDITLYANWTVNKYMVYYHISDTDIRQISVEYNKTTSAITNNLPKPEEDYYSLDGWYTDVDCTEQFNFDTPIEEDIHLYFQWKINNYTVTFHNEHGSTYVESVDHGKTVTKMTVTDENPTKTGYTFIGWQWKVGGEWVDWDFGTEITADTSVTAQWKIDVYTVSFYDGGALCFTEDAEYNSILTEPTENLPVKEGYSLLGWYRDDSFVKQWNFDTDTVSGNTTLYAKWGIETYSLTFDYMDGVTPSYTEEVEFGEMGVFKDTNVTQEGHTFLGWHWEKDGTEYPWVFSTEIAQDYDIYAKWLVHSFTVSFIGDGEAYVALEQIINYGETVNLPSENLPTREDYYISGWYKDPELTQVWDFSTDVISSDTILYAKWAEVVYTYTMEFSAGEGTGIMSSLTELIGAFVLPSSRYTEPEGYYFAGWMIDGTLYQAGDIYTITADVTATAIWEETPVILYPVRFSAGLGSGEMESQEVAGWYMLPDSTFTPPEGYQFKCWAIVGKEYLAGEAYYVLDDLLLTALWEEIPTVWHAVQFASGAGSGTMEAVMVAEGDYDLPECDFTAPKDYRFSGWLLNGVVYAVGDTVALTDTVTLTAQWEEIIAVAEKLSGTVLDVNGNVISAAVITLEQNGNIYYKQVSDKDGDFTFSDIPVGVYNLVITTEDKVKTTLVTISSQHDSLGMLILPSGQFSSTVSVSRSTPILAVGGLDRVAETFLAGTSTYTELLMTVSPSTSSTEEDAIYYAKDSEEKILTFFQLELSRETSYGSTAITETDSLVTVAMEIPSSYRGEDQFYVYRYHNGMVDKLTTLPNAEGEYIQRIGDHVLNIYTSHFSTYALVCGDYDSSSSDSVTYYTVKAQTTVDGTTTSLGGSAMLSVNYARTGATVTVSIYPNSGYSIDSVMAQTSSGSYVTLRSAGVNAYYFTQGLDAVTVTVDFEKTGISYADGTFSDVHDGHSFYDAVEEVYDLGLMTGTSKGEFSPYASITRGMIVSILYNLSGSQGNYGDSGFRDVESTAYYANMVAWGEQTGIIAGYDDGTFRPEHSINREELAMIFYRYYTVLVNSDSLVFSFPMESSDAESVSTWAKIATTWCMNLGVLDEKYINLIAPKEIATRAEVAVSLLALLAVH